MEDFVNTIDLMGDAETAAAIVGGTITQFHDNVLDKIPVAIFRNNKALTSIDLPNVTEIYGYEFFYGCSKLTSVNLPSVENLDSYFAYGCAELTMVNVSKAKRIPVYAFSGARKLEFIDLPCVETISGAAFDSAALKTIVLRKNDVCSLASTSAFSKTPFASGGTGGTVYVPAALVESYKTATNWSTLYAYGTCNFVAIEGSEYE